MIVVTEGTYRKRSFSKEKLCSQVLFKITSVQMPPLVKSTDTLAESLRRAVFGSSQWKLSRKDLQNVTFLQVQVLVCVLAIVASSTPVTVSSAILVEQEASAISYDLNSCMNTTFDTSIQSAWWSVEIQATLGQDSRQLAQYVAIIRAFKHPLLFSEA